VPSFHLLVSNNTLQVYEAANFSSRGSSALSKLVVDLMKKAGISARTSVKLEPRGRDGLGKVVAGLDHGCTVPFVVRNMLFRWIATA